MDEFWIILLLDMMEKVLCFITWGLEESSTMLRRARPDLESTVVRLRLRFSIPNPNSDQSSQFGGSDREENPISFTVDERNSDHMRPSVSGIYPDLSSFQEIEVESSHWIHVPRNISSPPCPTPQPVTLVVATCPWGIAGFCINPSYPLLQYYSLPISSLPWCNPTRRNYDSEGFQMKNLLFALLLFQDDILGQGSFKIYMDNLSIDGCYSHGHGTVVAGYLHHLEECHGVQHLNPWTSFVDLDEEPEIYSKFIVPAEHLARKERKWFESGMVDEMTEGRCTGFEDVSDFAQILVPLRARIWEEHDCSTI